MSNSGMVAIKWWKSLTIEEIRALESALRLGAQSFHQRYEQVSWNALEEEEQQAMRRMVQFAWNEYREIWGDELTSTSQNQEMQHVQTDTE